MTVPCMKPSLKGDRCSFHVFVYLGACAYLYLPPGNVSSILFLEFGFLFWVEELSAWKQKVQYGSKGEVRKICLGNQCHSL